MSKKMKHLGAAFLLCMVMMLGSSMTAFAFVDESAMQEETEAVVVVEENLTEEPAKEEEAEDTDGEGVLTPDGNLSLVDDLDEEAGAGLQYMTVQTKGGNYFYIIIDRSSDEDNVYFLNMVDEADLMALMSDEEIEAITPEAEEPEPVEEEPIEEEPDGTEKPETEAVERTGQGSNLFLYVLIAVLAAGAIGGYYFLRIRPKKDGGADEEELEFYDDEEYENEDEIPDDRMREDPEEGGLEFFDDDDFPDREA